MTHRKPARLNLSWILKATQKAGLKVRRIEFNPSTRIAVVVLSDDTSVEPASEFDVWKVKHARSS